MRGTCPGQEPCPGEFSPSAAALIRSKSEFSPLDLPPFSHCLRRILANNPRSFPAGELCNYEFRRQPEPVNAEEIVRELAEIRIETETLLAA